jgi:hypothetical protein
MVGVGLGLGVGGVAKMAGRDFCEDSERYLGEFKFKFINKKRHLAVLILNFEIEKILNIDSFLPAILPSPWLQMVA